jgi:hypothetical protein
LGVHQEGAQPPVRRERIGCKESFLVGCKINLGLEMKK